MNNSINAKCPVCGNSNDRKFKHIGRPVLSPKAKIIFEEVYHVIRCKDCRFYFVSPQNISDAEMSKLYDEHYFTEMTTWWAKKRERDRRNRLNKLQTFSKGKIKHFLDVGCGEGYVLLEAADRGWKAHGIDVFDNRVDTAKREDIHFTGGDLFTAKFPDNYFDAVYMDSVLEHIFNPVDYLKEIRRILTRGGVIYIGVPNEDCLFNDTKKLLYFCMGKRDVSDRIKPFIPPYHVSGFTKKSLLTAVLQSGFKVLKVRIFGGQYEFLKFRALSKPFLVNLVLCPIHLCAIPMRKQIYLEAILTKV